MFNGTFKCFLAAVLLSGASFTQTFAEETKQSSEQNGTTGILHSIDKKITEIEAQIDGLEKKGLENLTDEEFVKYSELSDKLLITQKEKTAEQRNIIKAIDETDKKIDDLGSALSSKDQ